MKQMKVEGYSDSAKSGKPKLLPPEQGAVRIMPSRGDCKGLQFSPAVFPKGEPSLLST